ncbi:MAG: 50S ribosomal protein L24 [Candidatus Sungbacteria bacterium]|uniref:Large ribosomal subunit protein uL24 n=1 Tax=Candidatus Sungiibacteriota bacterium TaxID=2750080 RepID=A0A9D6LPS9_9BACT|nr:50S ribosomal protein L24 [Candidatus Sungbacteria bacterium]
MKIKKGDTIQIMAGKDRGKTAKVLHVWPKEARLLAEGINIKKKHIRPRQEGKRGEVVEIPASFSASAAMVVCASCGTPNLYPPKFFSHDDVLFQCEHTAAEKLGRGAHFCSEILFVRFTHSIILSTLTCQL